MSKKIRYAYCKVCKQEVETASRKPLDTTQKLIWIIIIGVTLGIAVIAYLIYLSNRPKTYCPDCFTKLEYSKTPFVSPEKKREAMTPKEKILDKAGLKEEFEVEETVETKPQPRKKKKEGKKIKNFCEYCGEELDEDYATCPFCQATLKS